MRAELRKRIPLSGAEIEAYAGSEEEVAKLGHFCLGVVWRASLRDWFCRGEKYEQADLGPYQEEIRKYLKGDVTVPKHVGVMVILSALERPVLAMSLPSSHRNGSYHSHRFHIPGMTFVALVGGREEDTLSIFQPPHPLVITTEGDKRVQKEMMTLLGNLPPRGFEAPLVEGTEKI